MTTQEMHISIDLDLQKINSSINKDIQPEEKDWFLNQEVNKYINQRMGRNSNFKQTGFEDNAKRVEDLKDFIRIKRLPVLNDGNDDYVVFPDNYFNSVRFTGKVAKNCDTTIAKGTSTNYKTTFSLNLPNTTVLNTFIITALIGGVTHTLFNMTELPINYITNEDFKKQKFLLIKALRIKLKKAVINKVSSSASLYWEREGYNFNAESFTLVSIQQITNVTVTVNGVATVYTPTTFNTNTYISGVLPLQGVIRVIDEEFKTHVNNSTLSSSKSNSLTSVVREGSLVVDIPDSVILGEVEIAYICTPDLIDLHLDSNLNASRKVCEEIVSNTVRFMKALIQDNNYETYVRENMLIE